MKMKSLGKHAMVDFDFVKASPNNQESKTYIRLECFTCKNYEIY